MQRPPHTLRDGSLLEAEVAVLGAGPMGIVTALELADAGREVLLIESGNFDHGAAVQDLGEPDSTSNDRWHVARAPVTHRDIGGATRLWGGRCVPFDPIDFVPRPAFPDAAWPVGYDEIEPYLQRACDWCVCGEASFNAARIPTLRDHQLVPGLADGELRSTDLERWALPTRFGKQYRQRLLCHPRLILATGLTCVHVQCTPDRGSVAHLKLRTLDGKQLTAAARHYVLAAGGLETTRLLMASADVHTGGIGNHSSHLGRWYMGHVEARVARVHFTTPYERTIHDHERDGDGVYVRRRFTIDPDTQLRESLPNSATWIVNPEMGDPAHGSGILSGVYLTLISPIGRFLLAEKIRRKRTKAPPGTTVRAHLRNILRDLVPAARFAVSFTWRRILRPGRKAPGFFVRSTANVYPLDYHGEHLPHYDSCVELGDERDALGLPRLHTRMHYAPEDMANVKRVLDKIDAHLRAQAVGRLEYLHADEDLPAAITAELEGSSGCHQMGTTRMSAHPDDGVVTPDLSVHGIPNLWLASTSVFPSSSQAHPTLTGIAFAVRLAERLNVLLGEALAMG